jgi:pimeloyl-ACP methyl ester carboxylesterase
MVHGWPGTFYEFSDIIPLLTNPGGEGSEQAFNVVFPSLLGFCFSSPPPRKGWTMKDTARIFDALMLRLGYQEYAVQAGDRGQFVARELGAQYTDRCKVIHLNYCPGALPETLSESDLTEREKGAREKGIDWRTQHVGYAVLLRTRPQTVGWMLQDNPVGLLAFVGEKYIEASNPSVHTTKRWKDHILTTLCLYYFSNCIMTSSLPYYENFGHDQFAVEAMKEENLIKCPFGYSSCWFDTAPSSQRAVERTGKLVWYKERDDTGHFACLENLEGLAKDVREVVGGWWRKRILEGSLVCQ